MGGAVWGHIVGDAMSVPYEFRDSSAIGEVRFGDAGTCALGPEGLEPDAPIALTRASRRYTIERGVQVDLVRGWRLP